MRRYGAVRRVAVKERVTMAVGSRPAGKMVKRAGPERPAVRMTAMSPEWVSHLPTV